MNINCPVAYIILRNNYRFFPLSYGKMVQGYQANRYLTIDKHLCQRTSHMKNSGSVSISVHCTEQTGLSCIVCTGLHVTISFLKSSSLFQPLAISSSPCFNYHLCGSDSCCYPIIVPLYLLKILSCFEDDPLQSRHCLHLFVLVIFRPSGSL